VKSGRCIIGAMRFPTRALIAVSTIIIAASPPTPSVAQRAPRTLVVLLAHADDETAASPVLARYAREGVAVHMIIASDGSAGSGSQGQYLARPDSGPQGAALANARADEARCAAAALGARPPILLGFPDGKLGDYVADRGLMSRLTERIANEIERLRPDVVISWGPDGGTGHPDHRIVSNIATQLQRAGAPGMPERLFYMYLPAEMFRVANPQRGAPPLVIPELKYFTVSVRFTPADLELAFKATDCHRSQFTPELSQRMRPVFERAWNGAVAFIPAGLATKGDDLFR
jgi:LmbE family N-acetylglucosaminyl deacetylase